MPHTFREKEILQALQCGVRPDLLTLSLSDCTFAVEQTAAGDIKIQGWAVTERLIESRNLIVKVDAFRQKGSLDLFNGRLLAFHDDKQTPIGEVTQLKLANGKGVYVNCVVWKENSDLLLRAIKSGILNAFSIGFSVDEYLYNEKTDVITVTKGRLKEISIVNIGADSNALFEVRNALNDSTLQKTLNSIKLTKPSITLKESTLDETKLAQFMTEQEKLGVALTELKNAYNTIKDAQAAFAAGNITKSEVQTLVDKMTKSFGEVQKTAEEAKRTAEVRNQRLAFTDYRSMINEFAWLTDENGNKLPAINHKAYCLFQMPVNYDKMEAGEELKNLRNLHDAVLIADAMNRFRGRDRYSIHNLGLYKTLVAQTEKFDKEVALAMGTGNTGYGAEWVPSELSSEFMELLRIKPSVAALFQLWNMPKGASAKFPFQNGRATVYKGGEALVDNAEEARKTNIASDVKTFTPTTFIGALVSSEELTEDAILDMVTFIRSELALALLEGLDSAILNGDDSATHYDNSVVTLYQSYNVERSFKGLRKLAAAASTTRDIEVSSTTTGVNSLELVNFTDMKQDLGVAGVNPADCVYVTGIKGRTLVQNALYKTDALGVLAFMISGTLPTIDGSKIHISGQYNEQLTSAGLYDSNTDTKHTSMVCVYTPAFRVAQRRGITVEFSKNILTQQQQFVATARWDFGKIAASSITPVSAGINMQHTA